MIGTVTPVQKRMPITRCFWLKYFLLALSLCGALHSQPTDSKRSLAVERQHTLQGVIDNASFVVQFLRHPGKLCRRRTPAKFPTLACEANGVQGLR